MITMYPSVLAVVLRRRGHEDVANRMLNPLASRYQRLRALAEGLTILHDERTSPLFLMLIHDAIEEDAWEAVDVALLGILLPDAIATLLDDEDECVRYLAAETLGERPGWTSTLWTHVRSPAPRVAVAAAWGLAIGGDPTCALFHLRTHARELVPRLLTIGADGVRALCLADPRCFGEAFDEAATTIALRQRHRTVLEELAQDGSALAILSLHRMPAETIEEHIAAALHGEA